MDLKIEHIHGQHEPKKNSLFPGLSMIPATAEIGEAGFLSRFRLEVNKPKSNLTAEAAVAVRSDRDDRIKRGHEEAALQMQALAGTLRFLSANETRPPQSTDETSGIDPLLSKVAQRIERVTEKLDGALDWVRAHAKGEQGQGLEAQVARLVDLPTKDLGVAFQLNDRGLKVQINEEQLTKSLWPHSDQAKAVLSTAAQELEKFAELTTQLSQADQQKQLYAGAAQVWHAMAQA